MDFCLKIPIVMTLVVLGVGLAIVVVMWVAKKLNIDLI